MPNYALPRLAHAIENLRILQKVLWTKPTSRRKVDSSRFPSTQHSRDANYVHIDVVDQSAENKETGIHDTLFIKFDDRVI